MQGQFRVSQPWFPLQTALCLALAGTIFFAAGCGKKPAAQTVAPTATAPATADAPADMSAVLAQLTQDLRKYSFEHRHVPASFSELTAAGIRGPIPVAPAGKQFAIDAKTMQVVLVKQ
jgi:predicted small lipoprotein YifL